MSCVTFSIVALDARPATSVSPSSRSSSPSARSCRGRGRASAPSRRRRSRTSRTGPMAWRSWRDGASADEALRAARRRRRRCATSARSGIVDAHGGAATHTGPQCFAWAGGRTGDGFAAQGNILAGAGVVDGLADTFLAGRRPFPELLVACLAAADAAGGDRRGRQSAALARRSRRRRLRRRQRPLSRPAGRPSRRSDRRAGAPCRSPAPLLRAAHARRPGADRRGDRGRDPGHPRAARGGTGRPFRGRLHADVRGAPPNPRTRPSVGEPRELPSNWDATWQRALDDWMSVENLEERTAASGWIDRRVLEILRAR